MNEKWTSNDEGIFKPKTKSKITKQRTKQKTKQNKNKQTKQAKNKIKKTPKAKQNMAYEKFEGTKRVIGRLKSKKDIQYNE